MKQNTKDWIQYSSAVVLILSAVAMAFLSFVLTMDIGGGPLTYIAESLSTVLGIFGVSAYFVNQVSQFKSEVRNTLDQIRQGHETDENKH